MTLTLRSPDSPRMFCAGVSLAMIVGYLIATPRDGFVAQVNESFAAFKADVDLDIEDGEFEVMGTFTLGADSNGLDVPAETVNLQVRGGTAAFSVTIPAGSFKKNRSGRFTFQGTINRVRIQASILPLRDGAFEFAIEGERVNLRGVANPVTVSLTIGDDSGSRTVRAKIE